jgi:hypothetical protein
VSELDARRTRMDPGTRELLVGTLRDVLSHGGAGLGAALHDLGWDEVVADDPQTATTLLFTEHGRALASSRALDDVVLATLASELPPGGRRAVLYPRDEQASGVPGAFEADAATGAPTGPGLLLAPLASPEDDPVDEVLVPVVDGAVVTPRLVPASAVAAVAVPTHGFDSGTGWWQVPDAAALGTLGQTVEADAHWAPAVAAAHRALAAELLGVLDAGLDLARAHVADRHQYGRPIGSFQAVRHRLAEGYAALEGARASLQAAWAAALDGASPHDTAHPAAVAKLAAGRAQAEVMPSVMQVHGAMGLTRESTVHRHVTRAAALDALLGPAAMQAERLGGDLLSGRLAAGRSTVAAGDAPAPLTPGRAPGAVTTGEMP